TRGGGGRRHVSADFARRIHGGVRAGRRVTLSHSGPRARAAPRVAPQGGALRATGAAAVLVPPTAAAPLRGPSLAHLATWHPRPTGAARPTASGPAMLLSVALGLPTSGRDGRRPRRPSPAAHPVTALPAVRRAGEAPNAKGRPAGGPWRGGVGAGVTRVRRRRYRAASAGC